MAGEYIDGSGRKWDTFVDNDGQTRYTRYPLSAFMRSFPMDFVHSTRAVFERPDPKHFRHSEHGKGFYAGAVANPEEAARNSNYPVVLTFRLDTPEGIVFRDDTVTTDELIRLEKAYLKHGYEDVARMCRDALDSEEPITFGHLERCLATNHGPMAEAGIKAMCYDGGNFVFFDMEAIPPLKAVKQPEMAIEPTAPVAGAATAEPIQGVDTRTPSPQKYNEQRVLKDGLMLYYEWGKLYRDPAEGPAVEALDKKDADKERWTFRDAAWGDVAVVKRDEAAARLIALRDAVAPEARLS
jgi:hypothetical protein